MIDLARTNTDPDDRADFFEHDAGCRELADTDPRMASDVRAAWDHLIGKIR